MGETPEVVQPISLQMLVGRRPPESLARHLGLVAGLLAATYVAIRFMAISNFDTQTAAAALHALGPSEAVIGTLVRGVPAIIAVLCALVLGWNTYVLFRVGRQSEGNGLFIENAVVTLTLGFVPLGLVVAPVLVSVLAGVVLGVMDRRESALEIARTKRVFVLALAASLVSALVMSSTPWLPAQIIEVGDKQAFTGYLLQEGDATSTVLRDDDRRIVYLRRDSFSHEICSSHRIFSDPIINLLGDSPYPSCPSG